MRFPTTADGEIDETLAEKMMTEAYNKGVNYFDTAYPYHGGKSEPFTGKVLDKFPRDSYYLSTKLPCWLVKTADEAEAKFFEQLERLHKDYVDIYLLHAMDEARFQAMKDGGIIDRVFELKARGLIKRVGFSFHDDFATFDKWIDYAPWDVIQIQLNYMDTDYQAGLKGLKMCQERDIPVIVMEPIRGGLLANVPEDVMGELKSIDPDFSNAGWALRYVAHQKGVNVILSGMSNEEQTLENLDTFNNYKDITAEEEAAILRVRDEMNARVFNKCTTCSYCMPCPAGVNIPQTFVLWNDYGKYKNAGHSKWHYEHDISEAERPVNCVECGMCEESCPQKISIREDLKRASELLSKL